MPKKTWIILLIILSISLSIIGCASHSAQEAPSKTTITDSNGTQLVIPTKINRIADSWPAHNEVLCMLGVGQSIVATTPFAKSPWMCKINPQFNNAAQVFGGDDTHIEELLKAKPDIVFVHNKTKNIPQITALGIPTIRLTLSDFASLKECVKLTGTILGGESSQRAAEYITYLDEKTNLISARTAAIPQSQKPRVLHISSVKPLTVNGKDTLMNAWIELAGGINAAEVSSYSQEVSLEQIISWSPDIIIFSSTALPGTSTALADFINNASWQRLSAVKKGAVYINPEGAFYWDRHGIELALQIQWAAKIFHPDKFADFDITKETQYFYKKFFNYDLSTDETARIIAALPPAE
ncbi:MAG: hypothetical protein H6Q73_3255 [Firmicutes bacterium]|nr:hypothetical protein [Bacillota bacterium]